MIISDSSKDIFTGKFDSDFTHINTLYKKSLERSEFIFNDKTMNNFLSKPNMRFDLVIADHVLIDSFFVFALRYKCPLITYGVDGHLSYMDQAVGIAPSFTTVPHHITKYDYKMTFTQRCYNALLYMYEAAIRRFYYIPAQDKLVKKYFQYGFDGHPPSVSQVKVSAILVNSYRDFNLKPKISKQIDVGGLHVKFGKNLPDDLKRLYENIDDGAIYFSMGSYKTSKMPKEKLNAILEAFKRIGRTVFMQYDGSDVYDFPPNVVVNSWFPQNDILTRSKVSLFITNGKFFNQLMLSNIFFQFDFQVEL